MFIEAAPWKSCDFYELSLSKYCFGSKEDWKYYGPLRMNVFIYMSMSKGLPRYQRVSKAIEFRQAKNVADELCKALGVVQT